jgi:hypothetical protein
MKYSAAITIAFTAIVASLATVDAASQLNVDGMSL